MEEKDLPKGWKMVKLGEVADYLNGRAFKPTEWEKEGLPIIRIQNLNKINSDYNYTTKVFEDRFKVEKGDLLYAWSASLGVYIWNNGPAWLNQHIFKVVPKSYCDKKFLFYCLENVTTELYSKTHGSGMVHVTKSKFEETQIPLPTLNEQSQIVSKIEELFSEIDKGVEQMKLAQEQLKVYRQSVLKWAFEGKLTNENVKEGELPEGWKKITIGEIAQVSTGVTPLRSNKKFWDNGNIPWVTSGALNKEFVFDSQEFITQKAFDETNLKLFPKHTLLVALYGEGKTRGKCSELMLEATTNQAIAGIILKIKNKSHRKYIKLFLLKNYADIRRLSSGGVQPNLNLSIVKNTKLPLPPIEEQERIVSEIESRLSVCDKLEETIETSLKQAETLRQSILKKAFEGKLVEQEEKISNFKQMMIIAHIIENLKNQEKSLMYGEMGLAKILYLCDKIYKIKTGLTFKPWHFGPYDSHLKELLNVRDNFFARDKNTQTIALGKNSSKLFDYTYSDSSKLKMAVDNLYSIFSRYNRSVRTNKIELLATVCKVIEDTQSLDLQTIREGMKNWPIEIKDVKFKNKAEKFTDEETKKCIEFIVKSGWDEKLIK